MMEQKEKEAMMEQKESGELKGGLQTFAAYFGKK